MYKQLRSLLLIQCYPQKISSVNDFRNYNFRLKYSFTEKGTPANNVCFTSFLNVMSFDSLVLAGSLLYTFNPICAKQLRLQ